MVAKRKRGAIFCHVAKIKHEGQDNPAITAGSQKWRGKAPSFSISLRTIKKDSLDRNGLRTSHDEVKLKA